MGERDPSRAQITRQDIGEELTRLLDIKGPLGVLNVSDEVRVIMILESLGFVKAKTFSPSSKRSEIQFGGGTALAAGTVIVDSGPLQVGVYDLRLLIGLDIQATTKTFQLEWRNFDNTVTLNSFDVIFDRGQLDHRFALEIQLADERFRVVNFDALDAVTVTTVSLAVVKRPRSVFPETL